MDDREIIERILRHDRAAAEAMVHEYAGMIHAIFSRETDDTDDIEKRLEAFFELLARDDYQLLRLWNGRSSLRSYLAALALKSVLQAREKDDRRDDLVHRLLEPLQQSIADALHTVTEQDRRVIQLRRFDGLGFRDIGMRLGMQPDAVGVMLHRAEKRLRDQISMTYPALFRDFVQ